jgi:CTP:molybdopterin cytidylyltransferase MocA
MVPGIILAAGASSRMGRPKALLPTAAPGETFLSRLVASLIEGGLDDLVLVVGRLAEPDEAELARSVAALPPVVRAVENPDPTRGQLSSLQTGLAVVDHPGVRGMLVALIDVPLVSPSTVRALLEAYRATGAPVVRPAREGRHGHPVIFDRALFDALRRADPATGARAVVRAHAGRAVEVPVEDAGAFLDVDTPEDYARVFGRPLAGGV